MRDSYRFIVKFNIYLILDNLDGFISLEHTNSLDYANTYTNEKKQ